MNEADVVNLLRDAVWVTIKLSSPILIISMAVGLIVSVLQTTTSIQEQTLTFVPKLLAILFSLILMASWMVQIITDYTNNLFDQISGF